MTKNDFSRDLLTISRKHRNVTKNDFSRQINNINCCCFPVWEQQNAHIKNKQVETCKNEVSSDKKNKNVFTHLVTIYRQINK